MNVVSRISQNKLTAVQKWYREYGAIPRRKSAGGHIETSKRTMAYDDIIRIRTFITNYAEEHALVLPGRVHGFKQGDLRLLPSVNTKASIWRDSYKPVTEAAGNKYQEFL